ncbi:four-carbon acid sugar kinase family protein [Promicromonospora sukumoe]|uniref:four-carbon acid sugar kinase family protein n=1 Tax=Promicromonospora sukumoe TaxID=88382 RepID=UPI0003600ACD|nr:four-carbon acid sugar kinase family protein [Promicromonospora sukumoe]
MREPRVAFYGDDFTGSVDALLQFARRGWSGRLFVGLPDPATLAEAAATHDVVGVAGVARSLPTAELAGEVAPVLRRLAALRPHLVQYKACSTADSSPEVGSLGRVIELGRQIVADRTVPLLFAQPDFGRYTAFGHHFAAESGVVHRLDRQPTMSAHPSTPMTESDLAVHLGRQTALTVGSLPWTAYGSPGAIAEWLEGSDAAAVVLDALDDGHLAAIGAALLGTAAPVFAIGSGGLSQAVASAAPGPAVGLPTRTGTAGPVLAVSGSRSPQTRRQADRAAAAGWLVRPLAAGDGHDDVLAALREGRSVALTSDDADLAQPSPTATLDTIASAAAATVARVLRAGATRRVIVCGGDSSSRVTTLLGVDSLSIAANPWANVVLLRAHSGDPAVDGAELLLKGGQVGDDDLFERVRDLGLPAEG